MGQSLLLDTDILADYLRGKDEAVRYLEGSRKLLSISVITIAELYAGVRGGEEQEELYQFIQAFEVIPIDIDIAKIGSHYRRDYGTSHGTGLADALIAATAEVTHSTLVTLNAEPYPMLKEIEVPYTRA